MRTESGGLEAIGKCEGKDSHTPIKSAQSEDSSDSLKHVIVVAAANYAVPTRFTWGKAVLVCERTGVGRLPLESIPASFLPQ